MVLPAGTSVPPLRYAIPLVLALVGVVAALRRLRPGVDERTVLALAPWMATGSALYAAYQAGALPEVVAPLASSPAVYGTTFAVAGAIWVGALATDRDPDPLLAGTGVLAFVATVAVAAAYGDGAGSLEPVPSAVALLVSLLLAAGTVLLLHARWPAVVHATGWAGALVVLGHAIDGVSTAIGLELGYGEQTPLSAIVLEAAAGYPVPYFGTGWLFVLVKLALPAAVVGLLAEQVREDPTAGYVLLAAVAAFGLGPGVHNLVLFAVTSPVPT